MTNPAYGPTADIDLAAIQHNFKVAVAASPSSKNIAVIKANAYGHGLVEVAKCLHSADALGVARLVEGVRLRESGIRTPITLLEGVMGRDELKIAQQFDLNLVVHSEHQLSMLENESGLKLWLKLETGMHRLGLPGMSLENSIMRLKQHEILGVMGHFSNADNRASSITEDQLLYFNKFVSTHKLPKSLGNSAAVLGHPVSHLGWNRPGLMLYGASPFDDLEPLESLHPAMTLSAPVIAINPVKRGEAVGYGSLWIAPRDCKIAVVAIGYGDGYPREIAKGTTVFLKGARREIVGRVSMDMTTIELEDTDNVGVGDRVELWGKNLRIEEIARSVGTIPYTLMCGVTERVPRNYMSGSPDGEE